MQVIILAGGAGTRIQEETIIKPKPMIEVAGSPLLFHIMNIYSNYGFTDFIIALGYKGDYIKNYFLNFAMYHSHDICINSLNNKDICYNYNTAIPDWNIRLIDTGLETKTAGRLKKISEKVELDTFMLTYGDGVSDININKLLNFHLDSKSLATVTAVRPPARFGNIVIDGDYVVSFDEKTKPSSGWINGGFFVFSKEVLDYLEEIDDGDMLETSLLPRLTEDRQLAVYKHKGFWQCVDTLRDKDILESLIKQNKGIPWLT